MENVCKNGYICRLGRVGKSLPGQTGKGLFRSCDKRGPELRNVSLSQKRMCPVCPCHNLPESKDMGQRESTDPAKSVLHDLPYTLLYRGDDGTDIPLNHGWEKPV